MLYTSSAGFWQHGDKGNKVVAIGEVVGSVEEAWLQKGYYN